MSITDELRSYADHEAPHYELSKLHAIADRIDAEHGASIIRINETIRRIVAQGETIRAEVERLKAENAKLRDEFNKMDQWHSRELKAAMDENARLRKIAREQQTCIWYGDECDDCPHKDPSGICKAHFWDEYHILMYEEEDKDG